MSEVSQHVRLQPSLLDRLTDEHPDQAVESSDDRVLSQRQVREAIIRDLEWLMNTGNLATATDLSAYPEVATSVLNYGIPDLSGSMSSNIDVEKVELQVKQAIMQFEPRILRHTLSVRAEKDDDSMGRNAVVFIIEATAWGQPTPVSFVVKTELDLETGTVTVADTGF